MARPRTCWRATHLATAAPRSRAGYPPAVPWRTRPGPPKVRVLLLQDEVLALSGRDDLVLAQEPRTVRERVAVDGGDVVEHDGERHPLVRPAVSGIERGAAPSNWVKLFCALLGLTPSSRSSALMRSV